MISSQLQKILLTRIGQGQGANFYIIHPPPRMREEDADRFLACFIEEFCCKLIENCSKKGGTHKRPLEHWDILSFSPGKRDYKMEEGDFNELVRGQSFPPVELPRKIYVVNNADRIPPLYANKLLKTLEEPHPLSSIFFLNPSRRPLLPTVESRAVILRLSSSSSTSTDTLPQELENALTLFKKDPRKGRDELIQQIGQHPAAEEKVLSRLFDFFLEKTDLNYSQLHKIVQELKWYQKSRAFRNSMAERFFTLLDIGLN